MRVAKLLTKSQPETMQPVMVLQPKMLILNKRTSQERKRLLRT